MAGGLAHRLYTGEISYDFTGKRNRWYAVSAVLMLISVGALLFNGLNLGIEFKGGASFQVQTTNAISQVDKAKQVVLDSGVPDLQGITGVAVGDNTVRVTTRSLDTDEVTKVRTALGKAFNTEPEQVAYSLVGKSWGEQITKKGIQALIVFLVLVMALIWAYFRDWKMSVAAIVALLHDLVLTVGIYALLKFPVTPASLIGILTILGYSLYDTVVVFDKVRENVGEMEKYDRTYTEAANLAVNQVLVRSLNTTLIGVLPVAALLSAGLFVLKEGPLVDLGLALFVGMVAGAYSSIFIATPLLAQMREREPEMTKHRVAVERRRAGKGRKTAAVDVTTEAVEPDAADSAAEGGATVVRTAVRPRHQRTNQPRSARKK